MTNDILLKLLADLEKITLQCTLHKLYNLGFKLESTGIQAMQVWKMTL